MFVLTVRYIRVKQNRIVNKIQCLINDQKSLSPSVDPIYECSSKNVHHRHHHHHHTNYNYNRSLWYRFKLINKNIQQLDREIDGHNRFWSPVLTISFTGYILLLCYLAYSSFFIPSRAWLIFFNYIIQLSIYLLVTFIECSKLEDTNIIIARQSQKFMILFSRHLQQNNEIKNNNNNSNLNYLLKVYFLLLYL